VTTVEALALALVGLAVLLALGASYLATRPANPRVTFGWHRAEVLAALVNAGVQGIRDQLPAPEPTTGDLSQLDKAGLETLGVSRLPTSLDASLEQMLSQPLVREWFGDELIDVYNAHKRGELAHLQDLDSKGMRERYAAVY